MTIEGNSSPGAPDSRAPSPEPLSITALLLRMVDDTIALIRAEVAYYRIQAGQKILGAGIAIGLVATAFLLVQAAAVALLIGIVLALAPAIGFGWATAIVVLCAVAIAAILIKLGIDRFADLLDDGGAPE